MGLKYCCCQYLIGIIPSVCNILCLDFFSGLINIALASKLYPTSKYLWPLAEQWENLPVKSIYPMDFSSFVIMLHITSFVLIFGVSESGKNLMCNLWIIFLPMLSCFFVAVVASLFIEDVVFPVSCVLLLLLFHVRGYFWKMLESSPGYIRRWLFLLLEKIVDSNGEKHAPWRYQTNSSFILSRRMIDFACCVRESSCSCCSM